MCVLISFFYHRIFVGRYLYVCIYMCVYVGILYAYDVCVCVCVCVCVWTRIYFDKGGGDALADMLY
jgi:hypothetical protein